MPDPVKPSQETPATPTSTTLPPGTTAAPAPPEPKPKELDPFVAKLSKSLGMIVDPEPDKPKPEEKPYEGPMSIGEVASAQKPKPKKEDAAPAPPASDKKPDGAQPQSPAPSPDPATPPAPKPPDKPAPAKAPQKKPGYVDIHDQPQPQAQPRRQEQPPAPQQQPANDAADESFIKTLSEDEREEYDLAKHAETMDPDRYKDLAAKQVDFFKKAQDYATQHPDAEPDSEEFQAFLEKHRPKVSRHERQKIMRHMIEESASNKAKEEISKATREFRDTYDKDIKELKLRPVVTKKTEEFVEQLSGRPEGIEGIEAETLADAAALPPDQFMEKHPMDGNIVLHHIGAAKAFNELATGLTRYDEKNPTHRWLAGFLEKQEQIFSEQAPSEAKLIDGKKWVSRSEYLQLRADNPDKVARLWCFSDDQIQATLAANAHFAVENRRKQFEKAGLTKTRIPKVESTQQPAPPIDPPKQDPTHPPTPQPRTEAPPSPKSGISPAPSQPSQPAIDPHHASFLKRISGT